MNRLFRAYQPYKGEFARPHEWRAHLQRGRASRLRMRCGIWKTAARWSSTPGVKVYQGMIIGIHSRDNDLEVNVLKGKQLTNIRAAGKDEGSEADPAGAHDAGARARLDPGRRAGRGDLKTIRLRKLYLDPNERKRFEKSAKVAGAA